MRIQVSAALVAFFCSSAFAQEPCTLERVGLVPFETDETAHAFVPAALADHPTRLMLDTGGFWSVITDDLAKALNLKIQRSYDMALVDASGAKLDRYVTVPHMKIGGLTIGIPVDFVLSQNMGATSTKEFGGTLGLNFFQNRIDVEVDNAGKTISLFAANKCGDARVVHWADEAVTLNYRVERRGPPIGSRLGGKKMQITLPIVAAELEGQDVRVLFDTASTVSLLDIDLAKRRFGVGPGSPGVTPAGKAYLPSGEVVELYSYTFKALTVSGIRFDNVPVHLGKFDGAELVLGMHELKHFHLYFAFNDGKIHITAADAAHGQ